MSITAESTRRRLSAVAAPWIVLISAGLAVAAVIAGPLLGQAGGSTPHLLMAAPAGPYQLRLNVSPDAPGLNQFTLSVASPSAKAAPARVQLVGTMLDMAMTPDLINLTRVTAHLF